MKVFISYGSPADQVTALRLQALGAVNGLAIFVPPVHTRQSQMAVLAQEIRQHLNEAEVILGVVGNGLEEACRQEMNTGITLRKSMLVMCTPQFEKTLRPHFMDNLAVIDPDHPDQTETAILQRLNTMDQNKKLALLALSTLVLGFFIFAVAHD